MTHSLIPAGASHEPDLTSLTPDQLRKHHVETIKDIRFHGSPADVRAYKARYPETADYTARATVTVSVPKPPGFNDAVTRMVAGWLTSHEALARTNQADVVALNATFGGERFNPANFLNRPIGTTLRERVAELFAQRGHILPPDAATLSKVKQAAKAARAGTLPDATTFGTIGTLAGNVLTIGGRAFRVTRKRGGDYVRLYRQGGEAYLRLDHLTDFLDQAGLLRGIHRKAPLPPTSIVEGETGNTVNSAASRPGETGNTSDEASALDDPGCILPGETGNTPSLSERIARLAAQHSAPPAYDGTGPDPLELTSEDAP